MTIDYITIPTSSIDESIRFYENVMGFILDNKFSPRDGVIIAFLSGDGDCKIELIQREEADDNASCAVSIGFAVEDMDEMYQHLKKHTVEIVTEPVTMPNGVRLMQAKDPNGVLLGFSQT